LTNGGATRVIGSVKQSMVPGEEDKLTFLEGRTVKEIYYNEVTKAIEETTVLTIPISSNVIINGLTVFEEYIAIYLEKAKKFYFFEKPLVGGDPGVLMSSSEDVEYSEIVSYSFS